MWGRWADAHHCTDGIYKGIVGSVVGGGRKWGKGKRSQKEVEREREREGGGGREEGEERRMREGYRAMHEDRR